MNHGVARRALGVEIKQYNTHCTWITLRFFIVYASVYSINNKRKIGNRRRQCLQSIIYTLLVGGEKKVIIILRKKKKTSCLCAV